MYSVYGCGRAQSIFFLPSFLRHKEAELAQAGVVKGLWGRLMGKGKIPGPDSSSLCLQEAKSCTHQTSPSDWKQSGSACSRETMGYNCLENTL